MNEASTPVLPEINNGTHFYFLLRQHVFSDGVVCIACRTYCYHTAPTTKHRRPKINQNNPNEK